MNTTKLPGQNYSGYAAAHEGDTEIGGWNWEDSETVMVDFRITAPQYRGKVCSDGHMWAEFYSVATDTTYRVSASAC